MSNHGVQRLRPDSILVVDGSYLLHRSMHLPGAESGPHGYPVGAIVKCLQSLTSIVRTMHPTRIFWVHDREHHPERLRLYPQYKEKQFKDEEDKRESEQYREVYHFQRDLLLAWLPQFGVHVVNGPYECDDSIWYLTNVASQYQVPSVVVTEDRDFTQLLDEYVWIYAPHKEILVTRNNWTEFSKWAPDQIALAKAILGDQSDNIPSPCKGLGPTGLKKLFNEASDLTMSGLTTLIENKFHKIKKYASLKDLSVQAEIQRNWQLISFNAGLTFTTDYERNYVWGEYCQVAQHNMHAVMQFMAQYEMNQLLRMYGLWQPAFGDLK
jgi:5'-3' exonuclease